MLDRITEIGHRAGHALRVCGFAGAFVLCTAMSCFSVDSGDIQYAAGYGYVVTVGCTMSCKDEEKKVYIVFNTYDEAKTWQQTHRRGIVGLDEIDRPYYVRQEIDFDRITQRLGPVPAQAPYGDVDMNQQQPFVPQ